MRVTVEFPPELLDRVDARAKERGVTRSRFACEALERFLRAPEEAESATKLVVADQKTGRRPARF